MLEKANVYFDGKAILRFDSKLLLSLPIKFFLSYHLISTAERINYGYFSYGTEMNTREVVLRAVSGVTLSEMGIDDPLVRLPYPPQLGCFCV